MPAGLDGNPDPVRSPERDAVLQTVADQIARRGPGRVCVGIDGRSGVGKSTFADELATRLAGSQLTVVRSTTDSFHRPRAERLRRGPGSASGYYLDSHQLETITEELLVPFAGGADRVRTAAFDEPTDRPVDVHEDGIPPDAVLVFDGLFLHREQLRAHWDLSVLLVADERLDTAWLAWLLDDLPASATGRARELDERLRRARWPRYRDGWQRYVDDADPVSAATMVIDHEDLLRPVLLEV